MAESSVSVRQQRNRKSLVGHSSETIEARYALLHFGHSLLHPSESGQGPAAIESPPRNPFSESVFFRQGERLLSFSEDNLGLSQETMGSRLQCQCVTQAVKVTP